MSPQLAPAPQGKNVSEEEQLAAAIQASLGDDPPGLDLGNAAQPRAPPGFEGDSLFGMDEDFPMGAEPELTPEEIKIAKEAEAKAAFEARQAQWESQQREWAAEAKAEEQTDQARKLNHKLLSRLLSARQSGGPVAQPSGYSTQFSDTFPGVRHLPRRRYHWMP